MPNLILIRTEVKDSSALMEFPYRHDPSAGTVSWFDS